MRSVRASASPRLAALPLGRLVRRARPTDATDLRPAHAIDPLTLRFLDARLERRFQVSAGREGRGGFLIACVAGIALWLLAGVVVPGSTGAPAVGTQLACLALALMNGVGLVASGWARTIDRQHALATPVAIANGWGALALAMASDTVAGHAAGAVLLIATYWFVARTRFVYAALRTAGILAGFAIVAVRTPEPSPLLLDTFILVAAFTGLLMALYRVELGRRRLFASEIVVDRQERRLRAEVAKSDRLLAQVLPRAVVEQLREDPHTIADEVPAASVLFADLVGFTPLAARLGPTETVRHLNELFSRFDDATARLGLEKIKTIGDAYMAVGGLPTPVDDHACRAVRLGLELIEATASHARATGLPLALRVGVHSGPVVAGVIGKQRFSYDLWGDTVNVASRLESQGVAGAVQVSEETWALLNDTLPGSRRGPIDIKGRGRRTTRLIRMAGSAATT